MTKHKHGDPALWVKDPRWFPFDLNWESGEFSFARTSRAELEKTAFLDNRVRFTEGPAGKAGLSEVRGILRVCPKAPEQQPLFIFHTGFCCSTLMSRMLDRKGSVLVLKEPGILTRLSGCKNLASENILANRFKAALETSVALLNRPWGKKEKTILKVSNSDLVLLDIIQDLFPKSPMVFLYSDLKEFLLSVAKGGRPRRAFTKRLFANLQADQKPKLPREIWEKSDLHIAAAAWHLQMNILRTCKTPKALAINCRTFLSEPGKTLKSVNRHFGLEHQTARAEPSSLLKFHAKNPEFLYSPEKRRQELKVIEDYLAPALPEVLGWAKETFTRPRGSYSNRLAG